jgi:coniferyl-aldehyde dehydrogenase
MDADHITTDSRAAEILSAQRRAGLRAGAPDITERRADIEKIRDAVRQQAPEIAAAISADFGHRSRHETMVADIWPVLASARYTLKHLASWMKPKRISAGMELMPGRARILYQPVGVVGIISPWNYPVQLALVPLIAALAAGNRVMLKPSELTPHTSGYLAGMLAKLFSPEKVATILGGPEVGAAFSALPFDHLFYTGSTAVGRRIMRAAADNLTPVTLELGGKSPCIIGDDAIVPATAQSVAFGKLLNAGQTCVAPDYLLVPRERIEDFIGLLREAVVKLYPSLRANPDYTAIINDRHYDRIGAMVEEARRRGVRVIEINPSDETLPPAERKIAPSLLIDPPDDLAVMSEEIFGPVLPIRPYDSLDQAIDFVNNRPRPLALYYYGRNEVCRDKVLERTVSGGASVNETLMHIVVENLPFGGIGASGMGAYHGEYGFQTFSHRKGVFLQSRINGTGFLRPPFGRAAKTMLRLMMNR